MKNRTKFLFIALVAVMVLAIAACSGKKESDGGKENQSIDLEYQNTEVDVQQVVEITKYVEEKEKSKVEDGSENNPFIVNSVATLSKVGTGADGWGRDAHYKQTANIDLSTVSNWTMGYGFPFSGSYDGGGYTIKNLTINATTSEQGLFVHVRAGGIVKNVGVIDCDITSTADNVGGVVGRNEGGTVLNCYATGNFSGRNNIGGVVGGNGGTVSNCYSTGNVSGDRGVGGVVGGNGGRISNCYSTGNVSGGSAVGGVVGGNDGMGTVSNSVALNSSIIKTSGSTTSYGRVVGYNNGPNGATSTNSYAINIMTFIDGGNAPTTTFPTYANADNGTSITSTQWSSSTWWTETAKWDSSIWDFRGISETSYPKLR